MISMSKHEYLAKVIGELLQEQYMSVAVLAKKSGVAQGTIENWLDLTTAKPRVRSLLNVLQALEASKVMVEEILQKLEYPSLETLVQKGNKEAHHLMVSWESHQILTPLEKAQKKLTIVPSRIPSITAIPTPSRVILSPNSVHIGREDEIKAIANLFPETSIIPTVIQGLGGIGKTTLANEIVHRYGQFFAGGVWWLSFADPETIPLELAACAEQLDPKMAMLTFDRLVAWLQEQWSQPMPRLLIIDGCEDPTLLNAWLPPTGGYRILVTSRNPHWPEATVITLKSLQREQSIELLKIHASEVPKNTDIFNALAAELGDLPLALQLAGRYLQRYHYQITPDMYLDQVRTQPVRQILPPDEEAPMSLPSVLDTSLVRLDATCPVDDIAEQILALIAWIDTGSSAPRSLLSAAFLEQPDPGDLFRLEEAVLRLTALGLVSNQSNISLHPLIARLLRERWGGDKLETMLPAIINHITEANRGYAVAPMNEWMNHLQVLANHLIATDSGYANRLCRELGEQFWLLENPKQSKYWLHHGLDLAKAEHDAEGIDGALNLLSLAYLFDTNFPKAKEFSWQRLDRLPKDSIDERHAEELNNVAYIFMLAGEYPEAYTYFRQALTVRRSLYGNWNTHIARVLHNLGYLAFKQGRLKRSWRMLQGALAIRYAIDAPIPSLAFTINTLGEVALARGDLDQAHTLLEHSLELNKGWFGDFHTSPAETLYILASVELAQGKLEQCIPRLAIAEHIVMTLTDPHHRFMVFMHIIHGQVALYQGDLALALERFHFARQAAEASLGPQNPETAIVWYWLGIVATQAKDLVAAEHALTHAYAIQAQLWIGHYQRGETSKALAEVYYAQGHVEKAIKLLNGAVAQATYAGTVDHAAFKACRDVLSVFKKQD